MPSRLLISLSARLMCAEWSRDEGWDLSALRGACGMRAQQVRDVDGASLGFLLSSRVRSRALAPRARCGMRLGNGSVVIG